MKKLCLVTYTRSNECFTEELDKISKAFHEVYNDDFKVVICCEKKFEFVPKVYEINLIEMYGTKYRRLISLLEQDDSNYYLSIDNDITCNIKEIKEFVNVMISDKYEVGWGKIKAKKQKGFISNMVAIDKLLSHNIIRPLLWKIGMGISIPGQVFCIKGDSYRKRLIELDTFLDDLALGLYVNANNSKKYIISRVLGQEQPNTKFVGLLKQRLRWAKGYFTILKWTNKKKDYKNKVIVHGFSYHMLWLLNWIIIALLLMICWPLAVFYMIFISILIVKNDVNMIIYSFVYQIVFPIFHIIWILALSNEMIKGDK